MQANFLSGIFTDTSSDYRTSYPRNLVVVPKETGVSGYYLKSADGLTLFGTGPGIDRGGINWNGTCYRVMGSKLVSVGVTGTVTTLGDVTTDGNLVSLDYGADRLSIVSNGRLYYWDGATLTQVVDPDLGSPIDHVWIDGYYFLTDGTYLYHTDIGAPTSIDPLKYGSSEADPDPVKGVLKYHNEIFAFNRYTIEVFDNVGGAGFAFQRIEGAMVDRGAVGTHSKCLFGDFIAFAGSARNEAVSVHITNGGTSTKIATREIDAILAKYTDADLAQTVLEYRSQSAHEFLYVHLPNETLVYDGAASRALQSPIWTVLSSGSDAQEKYRARNFVYAYNKWICGDFYEAYVGILDSTIFTQYDNIVGWQFDTKLGFNNGRGAVISKVELTGLFGRAELGQLPTAFMSWSNNGLTWSNERAASTGKQGQYDKRLIWRRIGRMKNTRTFRFRGANESTISFSSLEIDMVPCYA